MPLSIKERFKPNEMPSIWGSPAKPNLPSSLRLLYGVAFAIILITASLQNNLIIAYIDYLQGDFGFTPLQGGCVSAAYYMGNVWTTILLFRFRQHFGLDNPYTGYWGFYVGHSRTLYCLIYKGKGTFIFLTS